MKKFLTSLIGLGVMAALAAPASAQMVNADL